MLLAGLAGVNCPASEVVHLVNGFDIRAASHAGEGETVTLSTASGTIQIARSQIASIETFPDPPAITHPEVPVVRSPLEQLSAAASAQGNAPEFARLVRSVAIVESGLNPEAISRKGAIGLMQLMPATARSLGVKPQDPAQNATGGAHLLAQLLEFFHFDSVRALAAYNAGLGAVQKYGGVPPFPETQAYVRRVLKVYAQLTAAEAHAAAGVAH